MNSKKGFPLLSNTLCKSRQVQTCLIQGVSPTCQILYAKSKQGIFPPRSLCALEFKKRILCLRQDPLIKKMAQTKSLLDESIEEINVPVMKPTRYTPKRKPAITINKSFDRFADWIMSYVPEPIKRKVNDKVEKLKKDIKQVSEEEMTYSYGYFQSNIERIMEDTDLGKIYNMMVEMCLAIIDQFQNKGSGWQFVSVESFDINVDPFKPLRGSSYFPLPAKLAVKKAIINVKNMKDNECLKWAITSAVYQRKKDPQRLNSELRSNSEKLNWKGIDFPTPLTQIVRFEKQNPYSINVYGYTGTSVYPLRISKHENEQCINLILLSNKKNQHYCWIKNISALTASQINKHKGKRYVCKYCCNSFPKEVSLQNHVEYCLKHKAVGVEMPKKGTMLSFKNYHRRMRVPFVVYADFEAFTAPISTCSQSGNKSYTNPYQVHKPCGFSYYIKCFDDGLFPPVLKHYTIENKDNNVAKLRV